MDVFDSARTAFGGCAPNARLTADRAKHRRRARRAAEFLEHQHDFADARFAAGAERGKALVGEPAPNRGDGFCVTGAFDSAFGWPAGGEEFPHRAAQQAAFCVGKAFAGAVFGTHGLNAIDT